MKIWILFILLLSFSSAFSQFGKKKKKQAAAAEEQNAALTNQKVDSLTAANTALYAKLDSVTKNEQLYYGLYTTIKEKVLMKDFDPARLGLIIDSIRASSSTPNNSSPATTAALTTSTAAPMHSDPGSHLRDSLSIMNHENKLLIARVDSMTVALESMARKNTDKIWLVSELKELKGLLDTKLISQSDYEAKKKLVMDRWQ